MITDDEDDIVRRVNEYDSDLALDVVHALGERSREVARLIAERDAMTDKYNKAFWRAENATALNARLLAALATEKTP